MLRAEDEEAACENSSSQNATGEEKDPTTEKGDNENNGKLVLKYRYLIRRACCKSYNQLKK